MILMEKNNKCVSVSNCLRISCSTLTRTIKRYFGARGNVKESSQNRSIKMSMILKHFLANKWKHPNLECIEQMFYVSGHSYNSCDRSFALIEKQRKRTENVHVPRH